MANTLLTPSIIAREALATLYNQTVVAALLHRDFDPDFDGKVGDTITVRKPATFTANEFDRGTGIVVQDATESGVPVTLDKLLDVSFGVTAEQLALELADFSEQLLAPAMEAIAQKLDALAIAQLATSTVQTVGVDGTTPTDPRILIDAGKILNDRAVPAAGRAAVHTTAASAEFLKDALFHQVDQRGDTEGLREASIGRKFGFDNYMSQNLTGGDGYAFHATTAAVVTRTLPAPLGIAPGQVAVVSYKGLGLRVVQDYDIAKKQDVISVDTLVGTASLDPNRAVKVLG